MRSSIDHTHLYGNNEFEGMSIKASKTKMKREKLGTEYPRTVGQL